MDLADAYVNAYDRMIPCAEARCTGWLSEALQVSAQVRASVDSSGGMDLPCSWLDGPAPSARLFGVLLGLHQVLLNADHERDELGRRRRAALRGRLTKRGRLNQDSNNGALVYARTMCGRPDRVFHAIDDFLPVLRRIPESEWKLMRLRRVKAVLELDGVNSSPETEPPTPLPIAQLPFLADGDDLEWRREGDYYCVAPITHRLERHLKAALDTLDGSGACLGILPETCLNDELLEKWQDLMRTVPRPSDSRLTWLLVGTGPVTSIGPAPCVDDRPPNRAVLLHRTTGKELLTQDKQFGYTLDDDRQEEYALRDPKRCDLGGGTLGEYIAQGETLNILDSHSGRYAVLICEDVSRLLKVGHTIDTAGVSHVLVPVLAGAMYPGGWSGKAAEVLAQDAGAAVAISNGLAIHRFTPAEHCGNKPDCPAPTLMVATPARTRPIQSWISYAPTGIALPQHAALSIDAREDALTPRCSDL